MIKNEVIAQVAKWDNIFHADNIQYLYHVYELQTNTDKDTQFRTDTAPKRHFLLSFHWSELLQIDLFKCAFLMMSLPDTGTRVKMCLWKSRVGVFLSTSSIRLQSRKHKWTNGPESNLWAESALLVVRSSSQLQTRAERILKERQSGHSWLTKKSLCCR